MSLSSIPPLQLFLNRLGAHSWLSEEERQAVLHLPGQATQVRANHDFVRLGEKVTHACLIVEGLVGRFGQNNHGQRQITALHIAGDMVDLHSVVMPQAGSALQALTTTTLIRIPHSALLSAARTYPNLAEAFWRDSVLDASILSQWVVNVGRRNSVSRMAHLLCEMGLRYEQIGASTRMRYALPATQAHLADALGLTSVHVNRTLKALRASELAEARHGMVQILDWDGLARVADFDTDYLRIDEDPAQAARHVA